PQPSQAHATVVSVCDNGYFQAMSIPLVRGRWFADREQLQRSNVVIVNETLVKRYFPREDPIGKRVIIDMAARAEENLPTHIVGAVADPKPQSLTSSAEPISYWPHPQLAYNSLTLTVRAYGDPVRMASAVQAAVQALDKDQPVSDVRSMDQWLAKSMAQSRFSSALLAIFASAALMLAAIGIYGVMSYAVSQRTSEIGVPMALGAERRDILMMVIGNSARLTLAGLGIGVALALALNRTVSSLLFEIGPTDPLTFAAVVLILGFVALLATYLPAHRATRIAPSEAL